LGSQGSDGGGLRKIDNYKVRQNAVDAFHDSTLKGLKHSSICHFFCLRENVNYDDDDNKSMEEALF
jgi:hypothetical protein